MYPEKSSKSFVEMQKYLALDKVKFATYDTQPKITKHVKKQENIPNRGIKKYEILSDKSGGGRKGGNVPDSTSGVLEETHEGCSLRHCDRFQDNQSGIIRGTDLLTVFNAPKNSCTCKVRCTGRPMSRHKEHCVKSTGKKRTMGSTLPYAHIGNT